MIYGGLSFTNDLGRLRIVARKWKRGVQRERETQQHAGDQNILLSGFGVRLTLRQRTKVA